ncbi:hypothetical protein NX773_03645 [Massilia solisilvae]|uniref:Uncharacterized protein n=1 Tax=Massilia solisilvae TaxID=1811225 RepID=A0ABT2BGT6_9BURK|nr:hypothetical protein [Massilia solisilvae]MCS0607260.1 hypothetical protein [Massilia solisilvae]
MTPITKRTAAALLLCSLASAGLSALAADRAPLPAGQKATLRVEFNLAGKEDGRPIHRTVTMALRMESDASYDGEDPEYDAAASYSAAGAQREKALAAARTRLDKLDMDAVARACDRDRDSAECQAGQQAFAASMAQADTAMRIGVRQPDPANKDRYQSWRAVADNTDACGTIEGRLLDAGKPAAVTRLPSGATDGSGMRTCLHIMTVDRKRNQVQLAFFPFEVARSDKKERGYYLIEGLDFDGNANAEFAPAKGSLILRGLPFQGGRPSGTASYRGERGVTTVKWSVEPR